MENISKSEKGKGRKKLSNPDNWKKNILKRKRHSSKQLPVRPICHNGKTFRCKCLSMQDVISFHENFYSTACKIDQDKLILRHIECRPPQRKCGKSTVKGMSIKYYVRKHCTDSFKLQVCQKAFLNILNISKDRVQRIAKNYAATGKMPVENRGGSRPSAIYNERKLAVMQFIEKLKTVDAHYCRGKSNCRTYLSGNLSIAKLLKMYNKEVCDEKLKVKRTFFRNIFCRNYNIGFGSPVTDACSKCIELDGKILRETDRTKRSDLLILKRVHMLKSKAFYSKLKEQKEGLKTISFDCQKNLVNPKIPDQVAYHSRQLYTYNFTAVEGSSTSSLNKNNVFIYTWLENEYAKGSSQICSAVYHRLSNTDLSSYSTVRLCADGCGGQNRNSAMITMCSYFLLNVAPSNVKNIEIIFPIPGHSFLPSDRIFGQIEKVLKKISVISDPGKYLEIFDNHGTVIKLGSDVEVRDWKEFASQLVKPTSAWHFQFCFTKRFILHRNKNNTNILIRGEQHYNVDTGIGKPITKKGKSFKIGIDSVSTIPKGVPVKGAKLSDINHLLEKHYGTDWKVNNELVFFKNLLESTKTTENLNDVVNEPNECRLMSVVEDTDVLVV